METERCLVVAVIARRRTGIKSMHNADGRCCMGRDSRKMSRIKTQRYFGTAVCRVVEDFGICEKIVHA